MYPRLAVYVPLDMNSIKGGTAIQQAVLMSLVVEV